ncbi:MAG: hypothetical protein E6R03_01535 [Hyphomicrobiaceae bacterium]|nr:MAG: hypothetical protein E6R03_01535 [Hyphomicrobiaceae bacterium]
MSLLALDLGRFLGYARIIGGQVISGHVDFAPQKQRQFEGGGMRYLRFRQWLNKMHAMHAVDEVIYEEVRRHKATAAAHAYGAYQSTLSSWCEEQGVPYSSVLPQAIKLFATGKAHAGKDLMIAAAYTQFGVDTNNDNEADAVALLYYRLNDIFN